MTFYAPAEDSYFLSEILRKEIPNILDENPALKFLEIGSGSGFILQTALESKVKKENIIGSDINKESVERCKSLGFKCIRSNLFKNIKGSFDIIVFNPPYLPLDKTEPKDSRRETTGGEKGNEISTEFLKQAKKHLTSRGKIFIVTSSLAKGIEFGKLEFFAKKIGSKKLFFEELVVWEVCVL